MSAIGLNATTLQEILSETSIAIRYPLQPTLSVHTSHLNPKFGSLFSGRSVLPRQGYHQRI